MKDMCIWSAVKLSDMIEQHGTYTRLLYPGCGVIYGKDRCLSCACAVASVVANLVASLVSDDLSFVCVVANVVASIMANVVAIVVASQVASLVLDGWSCF